MSLFTRAYRAEFASHWRALAATALGIGGGVALSIYLNNLFLPHLSREFGWTDQQFALTGVAAAWLVSVYAAGVLTGRLACGLALDHFPAHRVAALAMGLPALGLLLASQPGSLWLVAMAMALLGLSQGAEGDIAAYLVARQFTFDLFGTVAGIITAAIGIAAAFGGLLLSGMLGGGGGYVGFLVLCAITVAIGAGLFLLVGRPRFTARVGEA